MRREIGRVFLVLYSRNAACTRSNIAEVIIEVGFVVVEGG